jgi:hypothetical protein
MGFFDRSTKRKATREQLERLSRITHQQQRDALFLAIERGEEIPAYAWEPLPENFDTASIARRVQEQLRSSKPAETPGGRTADVGTAVPARWTERKSSSSRAICNRQEPVCHLDPAYEATAMPTSADSGSGAW